MHQVRSHLICDDLEFTGIAHVGAATPEIVVLDVIMEESFIAPYGICMV